MSDSKARGAVARRFASTFLSFASCLGSVVVRCVICAVVAVVVVMASVILIESESLSAGRIRVPVFAEMPQQIPQEVSMERCGITEAYFNDYELVLLKAGGFASIGYSCGLASKVPESGEQYRLVGLADPALTAIINHGCLNEDLPGVAAEKDFYITQFAVWGWLSRRGEASEMVDFSTLSEGEAYPGMVNEVASLLNDANASFGESYCSLGYGFSPVFIYESVGEASSMDNVAVVFTSEDYFAN